MKTSKYIDENGLEIEYIFQKSNFLSKVLIIAFPSPAGVIRGGEWGYLVTIKKIADVNVLFLRSNKDYVKSRMTLCGGKPLIEEAVMRLVNKLSEEICPEQIIAIGTSMGGYSSLYFGLRYNWDIISGTPPYTFSKRGDTDILYASGQQGEAGRNVMDKLLLSRIEEAGRNGYNKRCFISWGEGEPSWKNKAEAPRMVEDLERNHIKFTYVLYPFSEHGTIAQIFPAILEKYLGYYLGISEEPSENEGDMLSPEMKMYKDIDDALKRLDITLSSGSENVKPYIKIQNNPLYGFNDNQIALRNYVYAKAGWLWGIGADSTYPGKNAVLEPVFFNDFWDIKTLEKARYALSFYFQSSILQFYKNNKNEDILEWLLGNALSYIKSLPNLLKTKYIDISRSDHIIHMMYFIELHRLCADRISHEDAKNFSNEIGRSLRLYASKGSGPTVIWWQYKMVLGLLTVAVYYKNSGTYEVIYDEAMNILNAFNEYHFNKEGCCISEHINMHDFIYMELNNIMDFVVVNEMGNTKLFQRFKRMYNKISEFAAHIRQPDNRLPALGHTASHQLCMSRNSVKHLTGNFIKRSSNIALLEDKKSISYIAINGGPKINTKHRHCDLLSFIWNYAGTQVFHDAGSERRLVELEEYVSSSIAHNGFICDDMSYIVPNYNDFTSIGENFVEQNDFVMIPTSHSLIDDVELKRKFFWIKPNILILIDEGISDREHEFTQNFLMGNFILDKKDISKIFINISPDINGCVFQHFDSEHIVLSEYRGVEKLENGNHLRGTIVENWRNLRRGLNLAYSKKGKEVRFVTSIELHSKKLTTDEQSLQSVNFDADGNLIVVLGDGKIIYEKMPEKQ